MTEKEEENVMPTPARKRTDEWETVHRQMHWGVIPERNFVKFVGETYHVYGMTSMLPARFLEIGCGVGAQALWIAERGHQVRAMDVSPTAIQRLEARMVQSNEDKKLVGVITPEVGDITTRQYAPQSFDCVLDLCSLQHVSEADAIMVAQRARQWLRPRGWFYMKQAIEPFDRDLNRVSFIRMGDLGTLSKMFTGYPVVKIDMIREIVRGDIEVYHIIVKAQVRL